MPIGSSAGQVTRLQAPTSLHAIVSHQGYVIPVNDLEWLAGATYDRSDLSRMVTEANHQTNLQHVREALSGIEPGDVLEGRTSIRATTPDRLPYVGALEEGLYVNVGHGSRGMISAPFAAEVIASQITGEMAPLTPALHAAIDPRRRQGNGSR
jgi:tRNA 5-methylaminomethyl-2-thiouridine biosynthesis bifunctional protein